MVVVGGGWIGLETAAAARLAGCEVTVVEVAELPLGAVLGPHVAPAFADLHRDHGVDLRLGASVAELLPGQDGAAPAVGGVRLRDGSVLPADTVVIGVGVAPNVALAAEAGLPVAAGVLVGADLRTEDPRVLATGDIAEAEHPFLGRRVRVEHWANALNQPAVAAAAILGRPASYDRLPYFYTDQYDLGMEYTGSVRSPRDAQVVVRGSTADREFVAFWLEDGRVVAGMHVNVWDVTEPITAIIRSRAAVDPARLADTAVSLEELAADLSSGLSPAPARAPGGG